MPIGSRFWRCLSVNTWSYGSAACDENLHMIVGKARQSQTTHFTTGAQEREEAKFPQCTSKLHLLVT